MAELTDIEIREHVRDRYAAAARSSGGCGCGSGCGPALLDETAEDQLGEAAREDVPATAVAASLGCGVPTAVADLHEGETVLDLGSGAGADVLI
jgi:arsenite methyltransferase